MPPQTHQNNCISIIWDFDGTLTPQDSTTDLISLLTNNQQNMKSFWDLIKKISGVNTPVNSISTSETPAWMYVLSEIANAHKVSLDKNFNKDYMRAFAERVNLYPNVFKCLQKIKNFSENSIYQENNIKIHHFIITAGLQDLVSSVFDNSENKDLITEVFGCKYRAIHGDESVRNIPVYCMDKTTKTRSLFEINKGCFLSSQNTDVDDLVEYKNEWCHFENMIYIGDGDTDIPAFSLVKGRRGMTIGVYDPELSNKKIENKTKKMKAGRRIDLLTEADFSLKGKLCKTIETRCNQIVDRYNSQK